MPLTHKIKSIFISDLIMVSSLVHHIFVYNGYTCKTDEPKEEKKQLSPKIFKHIKNTKIVTKKCTFKANSPLHACLPGF